jgi:hypothetical protein
VTVLALLSYSFFLSFFRWPAFSFFLRSFEYAISYGFGPSLQFLPSSLSGFFVFLGTALYAVEGTAFVLPIQLAMKNKTAFQQV